VATPKMRLTSLLNHFEKTSMGFDLLILKQAKHIKPQSYWNIILILLLYTLQNVTVCIEEHSNQITNKAFEDTCAALEHHL
jgi:hypothetical protein